MKCNPSMMNENLGFFSILKEALSIPYKNPNFIVFTFLTSLPLACFMVPLEIFCQQILIEIVQSVIQFLSYDPWFHYYLWAEVRDIQQFCYGFLQLGMLYFVPLHFLDFLNAIVTVNLASAIHGEEEVLSLKEMLHESINNTRFKGPLITSFYVLLMSLLTLLGFFWLVTNCLFMGRIIFFIVLFGVAFWVLLAKWLDWNAVWNMGIAISILEERFGVEALVVSGYFSRKNRQLGLLLMLIFFVWRFGLRLSFLYLGWQEKGSGVVVTLAHVILDCLGNVMKWVVCFVYFYQCKKWVLKKKVDVEEGGKLDVVPVPST